MVPDVRAVLRVSLSLRLLEVVKDILPPPARVASRRPCIVVLLVPPHIHHPIDRCSASQHFASVPETLASDHSKTRVPFPVWTCEIGPVQGGVEGGAHAGRDQGQEGP